MEAVALDAARVSAEERQHLGLVGIDDEEAEGKDANQDEGQHTEDDDRDRPADGCPPSAMPPPT